MVPYNFEFVLRDKKGSRRLYESLVLSREVKQNYLRKWELELNKTYSNKQWSIFFLLPLKCTIDVKLRWFQFRIIHKILGVNSFLAKIGIKDSNLCTFCKVKEETIKHVFCDCPYVSQLWIKLFQWIKDKTKVSIVMDNQIQLFGILDLEARALNLLILVCRFYIYKTKMEQGVLQFALLKKQLQKYKTLEKYISTKNSKEETFNQKWNAFLPLFD